MSDRDRGTGRDRGIAADLAPFAVATYDEQGRCVEANAAWTRLHGLDAQAVAEHTWSGAIQLADRAGAARALETVLRGTRCEVTLRALRPDGTPLAFEAILVPRSGADGRTDGFHAFEHPVRVPGIDESPDAPGPDVDEDAVHDGGSVGPGVAARALGVSVSTVRRWIDEGRLEASRTSGGHRRVPESELRRLGRSLTPAPRLKRSRLPEQPLPGLAALLAEHGEALARAAARLTYEGRAVGWFARPQSEAALRVWVRRTRRAAVDGMAQDAVDATKDMLTEARTAAGVAECLVFLDRFSGVVLRALPRDADHVGTADGSRLLLAAMRRALAESEDERG